MLKWIRLQHEGPVLIATTARPPSNAVDAELHHEFCELFRMLRQETAARAIMLTGEGQMFSAGGDFDWFPSLTGDPVPAAELFDTALAMAHRLAAGELVTFQTDDHEEALRAIAERRPPKFVGR